VGRLFAWGKRLVDTATRRPELFNDRREARAAGVSERSLQYAFKETMGTTPTSYLTRVRLHRVRKALQAATRRRLASDQR